MKPPNAPKGPQRPTRHNTPKRDYVAIHAALDALIGKLGKWLHTIRHKRRQLQGLDDSYPPTEDARPP